MPSDEPAPTPEEIQAMCAQIRSEWPEQERIRRLRPDWRENEVVIPMMGRSISRELERHRAGDE